MQKGNNKKKKASFESCADCEIPCTKVLGYTKTNIQDSGIKSRLMRFKKYGNPARYLALRKYLDFGSFVRFLICIKKNQSSFFGPMMSEIYS